ncbi:MAG: alpha-xylosidase [Clostridia bacterium]|nr:alpha-xylosidase [Clostridia bacterium]
MLADHLIVKTCPVAREENIIRWKNRRITLLTPALFRLEESDTGLFCDAATQAVWTRNLPPVAHRVDAGDDALLIRTDAVELRLLDDLSQSRVIFPDGREAALNNDQTFPGTYRTLDCCDGDFWYPYDGQRSDGHPIQPEKGVTSKSGVALYDDSQSLLLTAEGKVAPREHAETDLYIFAYGEDYRGAVQALYKICGPQPLIPRYALGNWWSRYWAYSQEEYLALMDSFAERGVPFTVATVDMDWHPSHDLPDGADGWTGYTWNRELFPDYKAFLRDLHARNLRVTLNLHPALGVRWFEEQYPEMARRMGIDPATRQTIPFDITNDDFINAYFDLLHKPYERDGVDFWWIDWQQGTSSRVDGLDPLWSLNHYHMRDIAREKDGLILSRYAGIGSHRYPLGFSGDTHITWGTLRYLPAFTANASNAGYGWWSHDIGGHMKGFKDDQLFLRFLQFGVFSPINRLHSSNVRTLTKDVAAYQSGTGLIAREYLKLRHSMIPFLYSASVDATERGLNLIEPMYYEYPKSPDAYRCPGQYLFGRQMIAAPVTRRSDPTGLTKMPVWLPEGRWTDFFTGDTYQGGGWVDMVRPLESFPLLCREGAFFPLDGAPQGNSTALPAHLDVHCFPGRGSYTLHELGGGHRASTWFTSRQLSPSQQVITISADDPHRILPVRTLTLRLRGILDGRAQVILDGEPASFYLRREDNYTLLRLEKWAPTSVLELTVTDVSTPDQRRAQALTKALTLLEDVYDRKEALLSALLAAPTPEDALRLVDEAPIAQGWKERLREVVLSF